MSESVGNMRQTLHDLKQPLNVIRLTCGNLHARLAQGISADDAAHITGKLGKIDEQVRRMSELLEQLAEGPACTE